MITVRQVVSHLRKLGFIDARIAGSHQIWQHPDGRRVTVKMNHMGGTFPRATLHSINKQIAASTKVATR